MNSPHLKPSALNINLLPSIAIVGIFIFHSMASAALPGFRLPSSDSKTNSQIKSVKLQSPSVNDLETRVRKALKTATNIEITDKNSTKEKPRTN